MGRGTGAEGKLDAADASYIDAMSNRAQLGYSYEAELRGARLDVAALDDPLAVLSAQLVERAPDELGEVVFTAGGFESLEVAWALARRHFDAVGEPQRRKAIVRKAAIHGIALSALSFNGRSPYAAPFGPPPISIVEVSNTNAFRSPYRHDDPAFARYLIAEIETVIRIEDPRTVAMIVVEPVQLGGGCLVPPPGYWEGLREIADRYGILLVADDAATDFGRLGEWYGFERFGVAPDIATCGAGLTSARMPLGAVLVRRALAETSDLDDYARRRDRIPGHSDASVAAALRSIAIIERDQLLERVREGEVHLARRLRDLAALPAVGDVRGLGYFWAIEIVASAAIERLEPVTREILVHEYLPARLNESRLVARIDDRGDPVVIVAPSIASNSQLVDAMVDKLGEVLHDAHAFISAQSRRA
jgi:adenosylmethionine-8-amino-7-oxononanoate aminotransferase